MLIMALEACKQLADSSKEVTGYMFKNVSFHSALNIPTDSAGIEVNLCLRPMKDQNDKDSGLHEFRVYMYKDSAWHENCNGSIQLIYAVLETEVGSGVEEREWHGARRRQYLDTLKSCQHEVDTEWLYARLAECGYNYGPTFRAISALSHNGTDTTVADVDTYQWSRYYEGVNSDQQHIIHPTTLDCILQGVLTVHTKGGTERITTAIPTHVDRLWISNKGLSYPEASVVKVLATGHRTGMRETESLVVALDATGNEVLVEAECFKSTDVGSGDSEDDSEQTITSNLCHTVDWKPDLGLLSIEEIQSFCDASATGASEPVEFFTEIDFLLTTYIKRSLKKLEGEANLRLELKQHTKLYYNWMKHRMELLESGRSLFSTPEWRARMEDEDYVSRLTNKIASTNKQGLLFTTVGRNHVELLTGKISPLNLLFEGDLVKDHYFEIVS
jgi:hypothetical protein